MVKVTRISTLTLLWLLILSVANCQSDSETAAHGVLDNLSSGEKSEKTDKSDKSDGIPDDFSLPQATGLPPSVSPSHSEHLHTNSPWGIRHNPNGNSNATGSNTSPFQFGPQHSAEPTISSLPVGPQSDKSKPEINAAHWNRMFNPLNISLHVPSSPDGFTFEAQSPTSSPVLIGQEPLDPASPIPTPGPFSPFPDQINVDQANLPSRLSNINAIINGLPNTANDTNATANASSSTSSPTLSITNGTNLNESSTTVTTTENPFVDEENKTEIRWENFNETSGNSTTSESLAVTTERPIITGGNNHSANGTANTTQIESETISELVPTPGVFVAIEPNVSTTTKPTPIVVVTVEDIDAELELILNGPANGTVANSSMFHTTQATLAAINETESIPTPPYFNDTIANATEAYVAVTLNITTDLTTPRNYDVEPTANTSSTIANSTTTTSLLQNGTIGLVTEGLIIANSSANISSSTVATNISSELTTTNFPTDQNTTLTHATLIPALSTNGTSELFTTTSNFTTDITTASSLANNTLTANTTAESFTTSGLANSTIITTTGPSENTTNATVIGGILLGSISSSIATTSLPAVNSTLTETSQTANATELTTSTTTLVNETIEVVKIGGLHGAQTASDNTTIATTPVGLLLVTTESSSTTTNVSLFAQRGLITTESAVLTSTKIMLETTTNDSKTTSENVVVTTTSTAGDLTTTATPTPASSHSVPFQFKIISGLQWTPDLENMNSDTTRQQIQKIQSDLDKAFKQIIGDKYRDVKVIRFKEGSVIVEGVVQTADQIDPQKAVEALGQYLQKNTDLNIGGYKVDPNSLSIGDAKHKPIGTTEGQTSDNSFPTWAIGVIAAVCVLALVAVVAGVIVLKRKKSSQRNGDYMVEGPAGLNGMFKEGPNTNGRDNYSGVNMYELQEPKGAQNRAYQNDSTLEMPQNGHSNRQTTGSPGGVMVL